MELTVRLVREKETKNTVRFQEEERDEPAVLGTLYIQKFAVRKLGDPKTVEVVIRSVEPA